MSHYLAGLDREAAQDANRPSASVPGRFDASGKEVSTVYGTYRTSRTGRTHRTPRTAKPPPRDGPSMKSFAIANQKGGVAKTTNTINIAGAAADRGHSVLVVDADPQGHLTHTLGFKSVYQDDPPSFYDLFKDPHEYEPDEFIVEHAEFDVLPANIDMFRLEQDLIAAGRRPRQRLSDIFDELDGYDYVFVDAPPSLGPINDNVLLACRNLLIPVEAEDSSVLALEHLLNQIESLERDYDVQLREQAVLISDVDYPLDNEQESNIAWFEDTFEGRCPVFEIRNRAAIKRSLAAGGSIFGAEAEETDMRAVYDDIAALLEEVAVDA